MSGVLAAIGLFVRDFSLLGILPIGGWNTALFVALGIVTFATGTAHQPRG